MVPERHRVPGTNVLVDGFRPPRPKWASAFFLTHYHADHYGGLTFKWHGPMIYASELTAKLVVHHLGVQSSHVKGVRMNERCAVSQEAKVGLTVTLLDANHCPGSVLMLFETRAGQRYLHTGDMRYDPRMRYYRELKDSPQLDILYLDTTYCNKKYKFPVQEDAISMVLTTAEKELNEEPRTLILVATYLIGKERVLKALSTRLARKVFVSEAKERILRLLDLPYYDEVFTSAPTETNIHVTQWESFTESVPWGFKPHYEKMHEILKTENIRKQGANCEENFYRKVVGFVPTGWTYDVKGTMSKHEKGVCRLYGVPYSEHSSYEELLEWVGFLRPKRVVPTVGGGTVSKEATMLSNFRNLIDNNAATSQFLGLLGTKRKVAENVSEDNGSSMGVSPGNTEAAEAAEDFMSGLPLSETLTAHEKDTETDMPVEQEGKKPNAVELSSRAHVKKPVHAFFRPHVSENHKFHRADTHGDGNPTENHNDDDVHVLLQHKRSLSSTHAGPKRLRNDRSIKGGLQQSSLSSFFRSGQR
eukprot:Plantae.Rhodophyta-Purpureofilum_apyrenoidigerum.ctg1697.p1 GENE.Plantae.Rhodophyta-Purpureofilum_apyrenoidigerum.ctg1697~~Plantae.Rhodophyta-Purpureofilum_apyrenoidigerum.ctg1697.p1  ORF type:complete len:531 (+),score=69.74 Plantae.Rhodophyta-Purpureofilum_apyrenoidigerum.ctg1697:166-1758(+)